MKMSISQFIFVLFLVTGMMAQSFQINGATMKIGTGIMDLAKNSNNSEVKGKKVYLHWKIFDDLHCSGQPIKSYTETADEENLKCEDGNTLKNAQIWFPTGEVKFFDTKSGKCTKFTFNGPLGQNVRLSVKVTWSGWCDRLPGWAIAVTVVCVLLFVAAIAAAVYCCCCKNNKKQIYNQQRGYPTNQQYIYQSGRSSNEQKI